MVEKGGRQFISWEAGSSGEPSTWASTVSKWVAPQWAREYEITQLRGDIIAALAVAAVAIPQSSAHAAIAGVGPLVGLRTNGVPMAVYALLARSGKASVGTGALVAVSVRSVLPRGSSTTDLIAMSTLVGLAHFCAGALGLGDRASKIIPGAVVSGVVSGGSVIILATQLSALLGTHTAAHGSALVITARALASLPRAEPIVCAISAACLASLLLAAKLKQFTKTSKDEEFSFSWRKKHVWRFFADTVPLILLIASALLIFGGPSALERKVPTVEAIPGTHATLRFPTFRMSSALQLTYGFVAVAMVDFVVSYGVTKQYAPTPPDADSELRAFGVASLASSVLGGMPVQASLSRTAVNAENANTPLAALLTASVIVLMTQTAASTFRFVPLASIASVVVLAARKLFDHKTFNALRTDPTRRGELAEWLVGFLGSVCISLIFGVAAALIFAAARHPFFKKAASLPAEADDDKKDEAPSPDDDVKKDEATSPTTVKDTAIV